MSALFKKKQKPIPRRRLNDSDSLAKTKNTIFRRNSTIIGQLTYQDDTTDDPVSDRTIAHRLSRRRRQVMVVVGICLMASMLLILLLINLTATVGISIANSQGLSRKVDTGRYEASVVQYLTQSPAERLRFSFNSDNATVFMQELHPEISRVSQGGVVGIGKSDIVIELREPIASWKLGDTEYFVDKTGASFENNYFSSPGVQIVDESGVDQLGQGVMVSGRLLGFTGRMVVAAAEYGYTVSKVTIPEDTTRQVEATFKGVAYPVRLSVDRPVGEQIEDAHVAIRDLKRRGLRVQSLDVRVSGRAFYR